MERDELNPDPREAERCYSEAAAERAIAHVQREFFAPEVSGSLWPELPGGLPNPDDERSWIREGEDAYFARENGTAIRELAETSVLITECPGLCCLDRHENSGLDRLSDIIRLETVLARVQNRPATLPIVTFSGPPQCLGFFNPHDRQIGINVLVLFQKSRIALEAYLHEARHAFQLHAMDNPTAHPELHPSTIADWKGARRTYVRLTADPTPAEVEAYLNNPLEVDAREYVERRIRQLDGQ